MKGQPADKYMHIIHNTVLADNYHSNLLARAVSFGITILDWNALRVVAELQPSSPPWHLAFNESGDTLYANSENFIQIWSVSRGLVVANLAHTFPVFSLGASGSGIYTVDAEGTAHAWGAGGQPSKLSVSARVKAVAPVSASTLLFLSKTGLIAYDLGTALSKNIFQCGKANERAELISVRNRSIAIVVHNEVDSVDSLYLSTDEGSNWNLLKTLAVPATSLAFNHDASALAVAAGFEVFSMRVADQRELWKHLLRVPVDIRFSPDDTMIAVAANELAHIWNIETDQHLISF